MSQCQCGDPRCFMPELRRRELVQEKIRRRGFPVFSEIELAEAPIETLLAMEARTYGE